MTMTAADARAAATAPATKGWRIPAAARQHLVFAAVVVAMLVGSMPFLAPMRDGNYLMLQLATYSAVFIMALGQTVVVLQVGFDVSIGALQGLIGAMVFVMVGHQFNDAAVIAGCLVLATALGVLNGFLTTKVKINFIIVTLAMFTILPSVSQVILGGSSKAVYTPALDSLANGTVLGIRAPIVVAGIVMVVLWVVLNNTVFGRNIYATGSNREAARLAGVPVTLITMACYAICSLCAGIAGLLLAGTLGAADPSAGLGNEFFALTAVLLGGTRISGGHGGLFGTLLGMLFLIILGNILLLSGISQFWIGAIQGTVLLVAVGVDRARRDD